MEMPRCLGAVNLGSRGLGWALKISIFCPHVASPPSSWTQLSLSKKVRAFTQVGKGKFFNKKD
jgi:hypothetical protein